MPRFSSSDISAHAFAPPIVFIGQSFWITVVVVDQTSTTKTDYCGTTSFTSTDPAAKLESGAMDGYNFTWTSNVGAGCTTRRA